MSQKNSYEMDDLIRCSQGELFDENVRLPSNEMLMLDKITQIIGQGGKYNKGQLVAELSVHPDLWFFRCHFPGDPVMPGCLGLDALWQLSGFYMGWKGYKGKGRALGVGTVRFFGQVMPHNKLVRYVVDVKRIKESSVTLIQADGELYVDDKLIYTAADLRVGLFQPNADGELW